MNELLFYIGSGLLILWGIIHLLPTNKVLATFWGASPDNKKIFLLEWITDGVSQIFIGLLVAGMAFFRPENTPLNCFAIYLSAGMLLFLALLTLITGARTDVTILRFSPIMKIIVAALWIAAMVV